MDFVSEILIISSVNHFIPSSSLPLRTCPYTLQGEFPQALLSGHVTFTPGHKQLDLELNSANQVLVPGGWNWISEMLVSVG